MFIQIILVLPLHTKYLSGIHAAVTAMAASYEQAKQPAQVDPQQAVLVLTRWASTRLRLSSPKQHVTDLTYCHTSVLQKAAVAAINRYMLFNKKLLTYQLLRYVLCVFSLPLLFSHPMLVMSTHASLEEESKQENCDDGMRARNELLGDTYTTMQSLLEKLYSYVCLAFGGEGT